jgi:hypothetical protein
MVWQLLYPFNKSINVTYFKEKLPFFNMVFPLFMDGQFVKIIF